MSAKSPRHPAGGRLSDDDKKLWQQITENISPLNPNQAARALVRKSAYTGDNLVIHHSRQKLSQLQKITGPGQGEFSYLLKDADPRWQQKLRRGKVKPDGIIDLHGMSEDRAYGALARYIEGARQRGSRLLLVITGKGKGKIADMSFSEYDREKGILQRNVPRWLSQEPLAAVVLSYHSANARDGGAGALYVVLKRDRKR